MHILVKMSDSYIPTLFVEDLRWLIEGHFITSDCDLSRFWLPDWPQRIDELAHHPDALVEKIQSCKSHFLGSYFESLFSFAIEHFSCLKILLEHEQIVDQGKTLGELDMLVETPDGELIQFEIAAKFYLERPDLFPDNWIGPNKNDSLRKKTQRARSHQLTILDKECAKLQLHKITEGREVTRHLMIFGRLYYAVDQCGAFLQDIENKEKNVWIRVSELNGLAENITHFCELTKPHWFSLPNFTRDYMSFTTECIDRWIEDFKHDARPKHVCLRFELSSTASSYCVFVVPDTW